jgi:hypothetical protein
MLSRTNLVEYMQRFVEFLGSVRQRFSQDATVPSAVDLETDRVNEWIAENSSSEPRQARRKLEVAEAIQSAASSRSIVDDVDAEE